jgi:hypothetical protein
MVDISVSVMTCKLGGIDVLKAGMDGLHRLPGGFEFILVDELYDQRHEEVAKLFDGVLYKFKHVRAEHYPYASLSINFNLGARNATGKYVIFLGDYVYPTPNLVTRTWEVLEKWPECIMGFCNLAYAYPELDLSDPEKNKISIFKNSFSPKQFTSLTRKDNQLGYYQRRIADNLHVVNKIDGFMAVSKKMLQFLNGYDEAIVGDEYNQDEDFLLRAFFNHLRFICDPTIIIRRFRNLDYGLEKNILTPGKTVPYKRTTQIHDSRLKRALESMYNRLDNFNGYEDRTGWEIVNVLMYPRRFEFASLLEEHGYRVLAIDNIAENQIGNCVLFISDNKNYYSGGAIFSVTDNGEIFNPDGNLVLEKDLPTEIQKYAHKRVNIV